MSVISILKEHKGTMSNKDFAEKLKVSPQYMHDVLSGRRIIGLTRAVKIGKALGANAEMNLIFEVMNRLLRESKSKYKAWIEL